MGWTDDADEEGLIEENFLVAFIFGALLIGIAVVLYFVGFSYDPGWFEGQNIISTMGIIFLLFAIPSIMISTLTGKSDLVKWEAIFLIMSVGMVYIGNNFDIIGAFSSKITGWASADWNVKDLISLVLFMVLIVSAIAASFGKGFSIGSAIIVVVCLIALFGINAGWTWDSFFEKLGDAIHKATSGVIGVDLGAAIGVFAAGAAAGAAVGSVVPGIGTGVGALVGGLLAAGGYIGVGSQLGW